MGKRKTDDLSLLKRSLVIGASFNIFFLAFEIAGAVIYRSAWFMALSNSITGVAVGVLVIIATVYMIVKGTEMGKRLIQVKDSIKEKGIKVSSR